MMGHSWCCYKEKNLKHYVHCLAHSLQFVLTRMFCQKVLNHLSFIREQLSCTLQSNNINVQQATSTALMTITFLQRIPLLLYL